MNGKGLMPNMILLIVWADNVYRDQGPLLLTWFNLNLYMNKKSFAQYSVGWNYLSIPKLEQLHHWILGMDT